MFNTQVASYIAVFPVCCNNVSLPIFVVVVVAETQSGHQVWCNQQRTNLWNEKNERWRQQGNTFLRPREPFNCSQVRPPRIKPPSTTSALTQQQTEHDLVVHHILRQTNVNELVQSHVKKSNPY